jgi:hypothetical protein
MDLQDRLRKSAKGKEALANKQSPQLTPALRTVLLVIYGDKTVAEFEDVAAKLPAGRAAILQLVELGFLEVIPRATPAVTAKAATPDTVNAAAKNASLFAKTLSGFATTKEAPPVQIVETLSEPQLFANLRTEFVAAASALGLRGFAMQAAVEKAASSKDLFSLANELALGLEAAKGARERQSFLRRVDALRSRAR